MGEWSLVQSMYWMRRRPESAWTRCRCTRAFRSPPSLSLSLSLSLTGQSSLWQPRRPPLLPILHRDVEPSPPNSNCRRPAETQSGSRRPPGTRSCRLSGLEPRPTPPGGRLRRAQRPPRLCMFEVFRFSSVSRVWKVGREPRRRGPAQEELSSGGEREKEVGCVLLLLRREAAASISSLSPPCLPWSIAENDNTTSAPRFSSTRGRATVLCTSEATASASASMAVAVMAAVAWPVASPAPAMAHSHAHHSLFFFFFLLETTAAALNALVPTPCNAVQSSQLEKILHKSTLLVAACGLVEGICAARPPPCSG